MRVLAGDDDGIVIDRDVLKGRIIVCTRRSIDRGGTAAVYAGARTTCDICRVVGRIEEVHFELCRCWWSTPSDSLRVRRPPQTRSDLSASENRVVRKG